MSENRLNELLRSLKRNPTVDVWRVVLAHAIGNGYNDLLERLGGIESFVDTTIANAASPVDTKLTFDIAFNQIVNEWDPFVREYFTETERMLRLIAAKTPPIGFVKVLGRLKDLGSFEVKDEVSSLDLKYLDDLAMGALRRYFRVPPQKPSAFKGYDAYIKLLWHRLDVEGRRGHATQRLLELGELKSDDRRFSELINSFVGEVVPALLAWLLNTRCPERQMLLSCLYRQSRVTPESRHIFSSTLAKYGVQLDPRGGSVYVCLRSGEQLELWSDFDDSELLAIGKDWDVQNAQLPATAAEYAAQGDE